MWDVPRSQRTPSWEIPTKNGLYHVGIYGSKLSPRIPRLNTNKYHGAHTYVRGAFRVEVYLVGGRNPIHPNSHEERSTEKQNIAYIDLYAIYSFLMLPAKPGKFPKLSDFLRDQNKSSLKMQEWPYQSPHLFWGPQSVGKFPKQMSVPGVIVSLALNTTYLHWTV